MPDYYRIEVDNGERIFTSLFVYTKAIGERKITSMLSYKKGEKPIVSSSSYIRLIPVFDFSESEIFDPVKHIMDADSFDNLIYKLEKRR